jgi:uncharacterized protein (TIGR03382 family)
VVENCTPAAAAAAAGVLAVYWLRQWPAAGVTNTRMWHLLTSYNRRV